jgi:hypothetical protein
MIQVAKISSELIAIQLDLEAWKGFPSKPSTHELLTVRR